jgi:hypothetical protein
MKCPYANCKRTFTRQSGLTQHIRYHHPERDIFEDENQAAENNGDNIFNDLFFSQEDISISENEETMRLDPDIIELSKYIHSESLTSRKTSERSSDKDSIDSDDLKGASFLECAKESLENPWLQWPNEAYWDFARICVTFDLSDSTMDALIHFFNCYTNFEKSLLPTNAKEMRKFINSIEAPLLDFKEKSLLEFEDETYTLYYQPIIKVIKNLLKKPDITEEFIVNYQEKVIIKEVSLKSEELLKQVFIQLYNLI